MAINAAAITAVADLLRGMTDRIIEIEMRLGRSDLDIEKSIETLLPEAVETRDILLLCIWKHDDLIRLGYPDQFRAPWDAAVTEWETANLDALKPKEDPWHTVRRDDLDEENPFAATLRALSATTCRICNSA